MATFPCSICDTVFDNPRDLGTHILTAHCSEDTSKGVKKSPAASSTPKVIEAEVSSSIVMNVDPLDHVTEPKQEPEVTSQQQPQHQLTDLDDSILPVLPRQPTQEEHRQRFLMYNCPTDPPNFMRYVCLLCSKLFTSRYNIRMHLNTHTGRSVHTCPYCSMQFTNRQGYEGHMRTHASKPTVYTENAEDDDIIAASPNSSGPQIVSVKSMSGGIAQDDGEPFDDIAAPASAQDNLEEIEIEPDIIDYDGIEDNSASANANANAATPVNPVTSFSMTKMTVAPSTATIQKVATISTPTATHILPVSIIPAMPHTKSHVTLMQVTSTSANNNNSVAGAPGALTLTPLGTAKPVIGSAGGSPVAPSVIQLRPLSDIVKVNSSAQLSSATPSSSTGATPKIGAQIQSPPNGNTAALNTFTCSFCNTKLQGQSNLIGHLGQHVNFGANGSPKPEDVEKGYMSIQVNVTNPSTNQQVAKTKFMCLSCGKMFGKEPQVKIHLNVHYGDNIYNCRFCEKVFANYSAFEEHVKTHSEEYKFSCRFCNAAFINRNVMTSHQKSCPKAGATMTSPIGSPPEKKSKIVLSSDEIKNLIKAKDAEIKEMETTTGTGSATVTVQHQNNNANAEASSTDPKSARKRAPVFPFEPEDHYIPDNNSNNVINREEIVPPPTATEKKQGYCLRPFRNSGQQRYICTVCGKHYTTMYNMRQHRNIHTGSGLHTCRYCGRDFTHKHVWETHERIHTGERPFKCQHCPKDFADRSNYNSHRKLCATQRKK